MALLALDPQYKKTEGRDEEDVAELISDEEEEISLEEQLEMEKQNFQNAEQRIAGLLDYIRGNQEDMEQKRQELETKMQYVNDKHQEYLWISQGDLQCIKKVAQGSFGAVWKGRWNGVGGGLEVAIKKISTQYMRKSALDELCNEVKMMVDLRHDSICQVFGQSMVEADQEIWIVFPFVHGGNLYDLLASSKELPWELRIRLAHYAVMAVNFLHTQDPPIVHRDIKSLNYLVADGKKLLLTDFGLSKAKDELRSSCTLVSSVRWRAPETLARSPKWSEKSDIFSLGMVLFEIASREIPFLEERNEIGVIEMIKDNERPTIPEQCPKELKELIEACWKESPTDRPTSSQVAAMLQQMADKFSAADLECKQP